MNATPHSQTRGHGVSAFTLIELLSVIAIILLLASLATVAFRGAGGSFGPHGGAAAASSLFSAARVEAIMRQTTARVIVDTDPASPKYLARMTVAYLSGSTWVQSGKWQMLPNNIFFDIDDSTATGMDMKLNFPGSAGTLSNCYYYEFNPVGQTPSMVKFIVSPGFISGAKFQVINPNTRYGFMVHKLGRQSFFKNAQSIP